MAALIPADPALAEQVASRLRLSIAQRKRLASAADRNRSIPELNALAWAIGHESAIDRLLLTSRDASPLTGWERPYFALKGGTIVARGVSAGPEVARILRRIEERWVEEGFPDAARVEALLDEELAARGAN